MSIERFIEALLVRSGPHILEHLRLVLLALGCALAIAFPLGVLFTRERFRSLGEKAMAILNTGQAIPPLAVIAMFLPLWGLGFRPAVTALVLYSLLPIARNTIAGLAGVPAEVKEAARGMGLNGREVFWQVELPLSIPVIIAGAKTSAVLTVGTATLAALVGGGGMGRVIFAGIDMFWPEFIIAGTLIIGVIAIVLDRLLSLLEIVLVPPHLR